MTNAFRPITPLLRSESYNDLQSLWTDSHFLSPKLEGFTTDNKIVNFVLSFMKDGEEKAFPLAQSVKIKQKSGYPVIIKGSEIFFKCSLSSDLTEVLTPIFETFPRLIPQFR